MQLSYSLFLLLKAIFCSFSVIIIIFQGLLLLNLNFYFFSKIMYFKVIFVAPIFNVFLIVNYFTILYFMEKAVEIFNISLTVFIKTTLNYFFININFCVLH